jgi:hypothetical protein
MRAPSTLALMILALAACEPMDDPGSPLKPVPVTGQAAPVIDPVPADGAAEEPLPTPDPAFDVPEPIVIHSSELGREPEPDEPDEDAVELAQEPAPAEPVAAVEPVVAAPAPLAPTALAGFGAAPVIGGQWPLRLVATVPGAQPPRAILGLPGGDEIVVVPGTMLPEAGVVVMAIGAASVDLAEVTAAGDHAVVQGRTLQAQRSQRIEIGAAQ